MLAHAPYFEATYEEDLANPFHPQSPAGKFCQSENLKGSIKFTDPHGGKGGFGCSGAEFLSCWSFKNSMSERDAFAWKAWRESRKFPGSGADILTQAYGMNKKEHFFLGINMEEEKLHTIPSHLGILLSLFRTGQKIPTHEHLKTLPPIPASLAQITERGIKALEQGEKENFIQCVTEYGKALKNLGLLCDYSQNVLAELSNVLAAKGCGAMGADVLLVLHNKGVDLSQWEKKHSLHLVTQFSI